MPSAFSVAEEENSGIIKTNIQVQYILCVQQHLSVNPQSQCTQLQSLLSLHLFYLLTHVCDMIAGGGPVFSALLAVPKSAWISRCYCFCARVVVSHVQFLVDSLQLFIIRHSLL